MIRFEVHVHPGSKFPGVGGSHGGALIVRVRERATDGAANEAVIAAIAEAFEVGPANVEILRGLRARRKLVRVDGEPESLMARYELLLVA